MSFPFNSLKRSSGSPFFHLEIIIAFPAESKLEQFSGRKLIILSENGMIKIGSTNLHSLWKNKVRKPWTLIMIPPALEKQSAPFLNMKEMTKSRKNQVECFTHSYVNQNSLTPPLPPWIRAPNGVWEGYTQALRAAYLSTKQIRLFNTSQHAPLPHSKLHSF